MTERAEEPKTERLSRNGNGASSLVRPEYVLAALFGLGGVGVGGGAGLLGNGKVDALSVKLDTVLASMGELKGDMQAVKGMNVDARMRDLERQAENHRVRIEELEKRPPR